MDWYVICIVLLYVKDGVFSKAYGLSAVVFGRRQAAKSSKCLNSLLLTTVKFRFVNYIILL